MVLDKRCISVAFISEGGITVIDKPNRREKRLVIYGIKTNISDIKITV